MAEAWIGHRRVLVGQRRGVRVQPIQLITATSKHIKWVAGQDCFSYIDSRTLVGRRRRLLPLIQIGDLGRTSRNTSQIS